MIDGEIADVFFFKIVELASENGLISEEHFSVDGSVIDAWASLKSFQRKDKVKTTDEDSDKGSGNQSVNFHGEVRRNETHESKSDPDSKLYRKGKGKEAKLSYMGHVLMENRNGLAIDVRLNEPGYDSEENAALEMAQGIGDNKRKTLGGDKNYDRSDLTAGLEELNIASHASQNIHPRRHKSSVTGRTSRHEGYQVSQKKRKKIEEIFGWLKTIGLMRRPMFRGKERMEWAFCFSASVYNLVRMSNLIPA